MLVCITEEAQCGTSLKMKWIKEYVLFIFTGKYQKEILDNSGNSSSFLNEFLSGIISKSG